MAGRGNHGTAFRPLDVDIQFNPRFYRLDRSVCSLSFRSEMGNPYPGSYAKAGETDGEPHRAIPAFTIL